QHPEIVKYEAELESQIAAGIRKIDFSRLRTTAASDTMWYDIPIVVHIVHDYGAEYLTDDQIFAYVNEWNVVFAKQNADTNDVIAPFKKYIGNPKIRLHLATIDPNGNPTKGITRRRSYLTHSADDQAKFDIWAPASYINIWSIEQMGAAKSMAAAYAVFPSTAGAVPYSDGIISLFDYMGRDKTINHEMGHILNLKHIWGEVNAAGAGSCSDGGSDQVDDTPPTLGHNVTGCTTAALYDTICATNYFKVYTRRDTPYTNDSLVNYPDTVNAQNIMDYTFCSRMFTKGQVERMHAALNSDMGNRDNLSKPANLLRTGVVNSTGGFVPRPDLKPIPEFSATYGTKMQYFTCPGANLSIKNMSWNDTIKKVRFTFTNGASVPDTTINNPAIGVGPNVTFTDEGWVNVTMTATGNHAVDTSIPWSTTQSWPNSIYVASPTAVTGKDYYQEFEPAGDAAKWPLFNYYNNEFGWEHTSTGLYDNHALKYTGYDSRLNPSFGITPFTGSPLGDYDDFYSVPLNLTSFGTTGACNLNFFTSGASRSSNSLEVTDTFEVYYSINKGQAWTKMTTISKGNLANKGAIPTPYTPTSQSDWVPRTLNIPAIARTNYVVFRFRYRPGVDHIFKNYSTGNNFYVDRINFSTFPAEVSAVTMAAQDVLVAPNPTNGNAYVIVKDADNVTAKVIVSDITGKVVYTTSQVLNGNEAQIEIPASVITVKGIYLVQTATGNQIHTQKLVVY
ncbi:MAG: T9SS type A sorting domain-containing protein, partial [Taibaiella sp.]|nr:T9SS type A sorting domain-containing protein [Taibaiella sp.]